MKPIEGLYNEWTTAQNGFNAGVDFNMWIDVNVAELRAAASELQAAHVYLDESFVNDPFAAPLPLADRVAQIVNDLQAARIAYAALEAAVSEAREIIYLARVDYQLDLEDVIDSYDKGERCIEWLTAHPAPDVTPAQFEHTAPVDWREAEQS